MTGRYQAYPEYKDSGVEWIGKYPSNWNITRVKFESYVKARVGWHGLKSDDFTDEGPYLVTGSDFKGPEITWNDCYHCDLERYEQDPYIQLQNGDLLVTKDGTIGKVALVSDLDRKATLNSGVFVVRPLTNNYTSKFYFWLLQSNVFTGFVDFNKTGSTIVHLYQDTFVNFRYTMPGFTEQTQIANFLDHETTKIDTLIEKQQQLIKLLKEKRQAVISHAVTKGLNPDATMKDSGVAWLGEVPEHWIVRRLKHTSNLQSGIPKGKDLTGKASISIPMLRVANVQDGYLDLNDVHKMAIEPDQLDRYSLEYGDVLMNEGGDNDKLGRGAIWKSKISPCIHQNHVFAIRPHSIEPEWLDLLTCATYAKFHFFRVAKQSTNLASISSTNIKETPLVIPPEIERLEIMDYVFEKNEVFEKVGEKCSVQVKLLKERRTALISAAVTGKIDVRNWQLPGSRMGKGVSRAHQ
jgi:Restriction endonuclease S subunits